MIKLDSNFPSLTVTPAPSPETVILHTDIHTNLNTARQLIVLIPNAESDCTPALHRIWELAHVLQCSVLFLGLCGDVLEEPKLRRALITTAALIQDGRVSVETKTEIGNNWLKVVHSNWREGDLILCFANQQAGLLQRPLGQILESKLNTTVYVLPWLETTAHRTVGWLSTLTLWGGFIATAVGFFILQVNIDKAMKGGLQTMMLVLTVLVEFWLIWVWNKLFS